MISTATVMIASIPAVIIAFILDAIGGKAVSRRGARLRPVRLWF